MEHLIQDGFDLIRRQNWNMHFWVTPYDILHVFERLAYLVKSTAPLSYIIILGLTFYICATYKSRRQMRVDSMGNIGYAPNRTHAFKWGPVSFTVVMVCVIAVLARIDFTTAVPWSSLVPSSLTSLSHTTVPHSIRSFSHPTFYISHVDYEMYIRADERTHEFRQESSFRVIPGLADPEGVTLESVDLPGHVLAHTYGLLALVKADKNIRTKQNSTFYRRTGLASEGGVSYESLVLKNHFIAVEQLGLKIMRYSASDEFKEHATFFEEPSLAQKY